MSQSLYQFSSSLAGKGRLLATVAVVAGAVAALLLGDGHSPFGTYHDM
jgi:hypothetical protein